MSDCVPSRYWKGALVVKDRRCFHLHESGGWRMVSLESAEGAKIDDYLRGVEEAERKALLDRQREALLYKQARLKRKLERVESELAALG